MGSRPLTESTSNLSRSLSYCIIVADAYQSGVRLKKMHQARNFHLDMFPPDTVNKHTLDSYQGG